MSWEQIAAEKYDHVGRPDTPYFSGSQLMSARIAVADVQAKAREAAEKAKADSKKDDAVRFSPVAAETK